MKQQLIHILSVLFQACDGFFCRLHLKRPYVVVFVDGGICSQMLMYLQGQYYAETGIDVRYDLLWFQTHGKDSMGIMPRTFELTEMWPNLEFKSLSKIQRKWYLLFFKAKRTHGDLLPTPDSIEHSIYLDNWWDLQIDDHKRLFAKYFDISNASVLTSCSNVDFTQCVGVHVRRGDLAKGDNPYYGGVSDGYFLKSIDFCNEKFEPKKYLFFSDEPDWVEQNICNHLKQPYEIMRGNKAWEDLWLLAHCPVIVASQGSFGPMAAKLNPNAVLIQCDNKFAMRERENTYYIC